MMRALEAIVAVSLRDEAAAAQLLPTIRPPLVLSMPATFPGIAQIRGPEEDLGAFLSPHLQAGWHLWVEWVERPD